MTENRLMITLRLKHQINDEAMDKLGENIKALIQAYQPSIPLTRITIRQFPVTTIEVNAV